MDVELSEVSRIQVKLDNDDMRLLVEGEKLVVDVDNSFYLELIHAPALNYDVKKPYLNGEYEPDK